MKALQQGKYPVPQHVTTVTCGILRVLSQTDFGAGNLAVE
jgi:hypothetical protein